MSERQAADFINVVQAATLGLVVLGLVPVVGMGSSHAAFAIAVLVSGMASGSCLFSALLGLVLHRHRVEQVCGQPLPAGLARVSDLLLTEFYLGLAGFCFLAVLVQSGSAVGWYLLVAFLPLVGIVYTRTEIGRTGEVAGIELGATWTRVSSLGGVAHLVILLAMAATLLLGMLAANQVAGAAMRNYEATQAHPDDAPELKGDRDYIGEDLVSEEASINCLRSAADVFARSIRRDDTMWDISRSLLRRDGERYSDADVHQLLLELQALNRTRIREAGNFDLIFPEDSLWIPGRFSVCD